MEKFKKLNLDKRILKAIEDAGFEEPSEIQEKIIPLALEGRDLMGSSATGSGKTLAFGAGIIEKTRKGEGVQALILTPTRELAEQVARTLRIFSRDFGLNVKEVYGGVAIGPQINALTKAEIVVGTPGRILDHLERRTLNLRNVKFLVLDEADRMLEMGFIDDVERIINACPKERQTLLFSATISHDIEIIARRYMKNPIHIQVETYVDPSKLHQIFYDVPQDRKFSLLVHLLKKEKSGFVMVFSNTRRNTDTVSRNLKRHGVQALAIHGGLSQNKRSSIMKSFNSRNALILVCTDVAARGLDIKDISHVYNYDIPKNSTEYIHRVGRTARAGKEGIAVSLVSPRDYENFRRVKEDDSLNIKNEPLPEFEILAANFGASRRDDFGRGRSFDRFNKPSRRGGSFGQRRGFDGGNFKSRSEGGRRGGRSFGRGGRDGGNFGREQGGRARGGDGRRRRDSRSFKNERKDNRFRRRY